MSIKCAVIFERAPNNQAGYVRGHLETLLECGDPEPEPASVAGEVEVVPAA
jgi:hypothetical protein